MCVLYKVYIQIEQKINMVHKITWASEPGTGLGHIEQDKCLHFRKFSKENIY